MCAPEANAYEFQSGGVIEMLEKLLNKFIAERTTLEKEEINFKHAYDMLMQDLKAQIAQITQDRGGKSELNAEILQSKTDAKSDLEHTTSPHNGPSAPKVNAYEFKFSGVIEMLEKLLDKFIHQDDVSVDPQTVYYISFLIMRKSVCLC